MSAGYQDDDDDGLLGVARLAPKHIKLGPAPKPPEEPPPHDFPPEATAAPPKPNGARHAPSIPASEAGTHPRFHLNWAELADQEPPAREWAVPGYLGMGHVTLLAGVGGVGKSLLAQQIESCLCMGRAYIGDAPDREFRCLGWFCEDDKDELWRRQRRIERWLKVGEEEFQGRLYIEPRLGLDNTLFWQPRSDSPCFNQTLLTQLIEQTNDFRANVVVLDNVAQLFGGNANDTHQATQFINGLCGALPGCAILLLAHPAKSQGSEYSGNVAWENAARTRLYLGSKLPDQPDSDQEADTLYLCNRKANYSAKDYRVLRFTDGLLLPDAPEQQGGIVGHARKARAETVILAAVQQLYQRQIRTQPGPRSPAYLVRLMLDAEIADGVKKSDLSGALARLMADGKIVESPFGRSKHRVEQTTLVCG